MVSRMPSLVGVLAVLAACDPDFRFEGSVLDTTGHPIVGAETEIQCATTFAEAITDSVGRFSRLRAGWCPDTCTIEVHSAGYRPWTAPVRGYCKTRPAHLRDACVDVDADIVMTAIPGAPVVLPSGK